MSTWLICVVAYLGIGLLLGFAQLLRSYDRNPSGVAAAAAVILAWLPIGISYIIQDALGNLDDELDFEDEEDPQ